eukprot:1725911-Prymnesium_polylepis.1
MRFDHRAPEGGPTRAGARREGVVRPTAQAEVEAGGVGGGWLEARQLDGRRRRASSTRRTSRPLFLTGAPGS